VLRVVVCHIASETSLEEIQFAFEGSLSDGGVSTRTGGSSWHTAASFRRVRLGEELGVSTTGETCPRSCCNRKASPLDS
jgi:hypothetical protein